MTPLIRQLAASLACLLIALAASGCAGNPAWASLVESDLRKRPEFAAVRNHPELPNVLIYGDSISVQYTKTVQDNLKGEADVYRLHCNGGDSGSFIPKMERMHAVMRDSKWKGYWDFDWDVIQFNVGLHDLKYVHQGELDLQRGKQVNSLDRYRRNLEGIIAYLEQLSPDATLIFATTTPVAEGADGRVANDELRYNEVALEVLRRHPEILINDLHGLASPHQQEWALTPGNVHFNDHGRKALGNQVSAVIREALEERKAASP